MPDGMPVLRRRRWTCTRSRGRDSGATTARVMPTVSLDINHGFARVRAGHHLPEGLLTNVSHDFTV